MNVKLCYPRTTANVIICAFLDICLEIEIRTPMA